MPSMVADRIHDGQRFPVDTTARNEPSPPAISPADAGCYPLLTINSPSIRHY